MKKFVIVLFGVIFTTLIASSVQSIYADHLEPGRGIFYDMDKVNLNTARDSKFLVILKVEIRDTQNQLVAISDGGAGYYIPHKISDNIFDESLGKKEIVTIDNIKYEKVQYTGKQQMELVYFGEKTSVEKSLEEYNTRKHFIGNWQLQLCSEFEGHGHDCIGIFQVNTALLAVAEDDIITNHWTILRIIN